MAQSSIEWTEVTWNPVTGCTKISTGCKYCYAESFAKRLQAMKVEKYRKGFKLTMHPKALHEPYLWKKSRTVFVNSMSDLFHKNVPLKFIQAVFKVMHENPHHVFQVLTKRPDILLSYDKEGQIEWSSNIWMGVSVENAEMEKRINLLRRTKARVKFLSCEPLIGPLSKLNLKGINWVIVGGESGLKPRPMNPQWVYEIRKQCQMSDVPFFFKQWGGRNKKKAGRLLDDRTWDEMPQLSAIRG